MGNRCSRAARGDAIFRSASPPHAQFPRKMAMAMPAMRQYLDAKREDRDAIVLFRMGTSTRCSTRTRGRARRAGADADLPNDGARRRRIPMGGVRNRRPRRIRRGWSRRASAWRIGEQVEDRGRRPASSSWKSVRVVSPGTFTEAGLPRCPRAGLHHGDSLGGPARGNAEGLFLASTAARDTDGRLGRRRWRCSPIDRRVPGGRRRRAGRGRGAAR